MAGIERIRIKGFGCIEDVELGLGPLQAFIGPNDSGKSTILRAVELAVAAALEPGFAVAVEDPRIRAGASLAIEAAGQSFSFASDRPGLLAPVADWRAVGDRARALLGGGTARVRERFPTVKHIGLRNASTTHKQLQIELIDGTKIPAAVASEGLLDFLAFATLPYLHDSASILLIEEPENGLHPARIRDIVATLREIAKTTQILIATHSPILVNELEPHEVFVTTRAPNTGTRVTRLDRTPNFAERSRVYHPGELWIAYADGDTEAALLGEDEA